MLIIGLPFADEATVGNGVMLGIAAPSREMVDAIFAKAIELGGTSEGDPGPRGPEGSGYYACYFRDLDGNKVMVNHVQKPSTGGFSPLARARFVADFILRLGSEVGSVVAFMQLACLRRLNVRRPRLERPVQARNYDFIIAVTWSPQAPCAWLRRVRASSTVKPAATACSMLWLRSAIARVSVSAAFCWPGESGLIWVWSGMAH